MCGIAGLFLPHGKGGITADLDAMAAVMAHRGPDGGGRFVSDDGGYQACFRRLSIIDLATGDQPIIDPATGRVLFGNGEIYNYLELRAEEPDYPYRTTGDMEVILPLAARHGDTFLDRLNGMYGLALFDPRTHRLLLARDRLGVKPLYWSRLPGGGVVFASEIKPLFASGLMRPAIDETAVSAYLAHGYVPGPRTLFAGVNKLQPGHVLTADAKGEVRIERYWRARPIADLPTDEAEIGEHLTALLRDSVRLQLRSDVPVAMLLSGGIDSGLLTALAAAETPLPLNTYTVRFENGVADESPLAAAVAERYGTRHTCFDLPGASVADLLPRLAWLAEEPLNDAALLPNYLIERELGRHAKVALNGTGGDELFAGYGRYFQLPIEARFLRVPKTLRDTLITPMVGRMSLMKAWQLRRAEFFETDRGRYLHEHSNQFPMPIRLLIGNRLRPVEGAQEGFFEEYGGPAQSGALYADLNSYLPEDLLTLLDRTAMGASVEGRVPFLDHRFVEAALAVPPEIRTKDGRQKALLRAMATPYLPESVLTAPKRGFQSPVPAWMRAGLGDLARAVLTRPETLARGWWSREGIERLLAAPDRHGYRVYSLLMLELAVRIHVEQPLSLDAPSFGLAEMVDG